MHGTLMSKSHLPRGAQGMWSSDSPPHIPLMRLVEWRSTTCVLSAMRTTTEMSERRRKGKEDNDDTGSKEREKAGGTVGEKEEEIRGETAQFSDKGGEPPEETFGEEALSAASILSPSSSAVMPGSRSASTQGPALPRERLPTRLGASRLEPERSPRHVHQ